MRGVDNLSVARQQKHRNREQFLVCNKLSSRQFILTDKISLH